MMYNIIVVSRHKKDTYSVEWSTIFVNKYDLMFYVIPTGFYNIVSPYLPPPVGLERVTATLNKQTLICWQLNLSKLYVCRYYMFIYSLLHV